MPKPALLTDEAVQAAQVVRAHGFETRIVLSALLRFHATEGRETLIEEVMQQIAVGMRLTVPMVTESRLRDAAETVVTALVGARDA